MPRATQSKESAIIAFFRAAELPIAQLVHRLATEALKERLTRSKEAKARAATPAARTPAAPTPTAAPPAKKAKAKKRKARKPRTQITEADLNGPADGSVDTE